MAPRESRRQHPYTSMVLEHIVNQDMSDGILTAYQQQRGFPPAQVLRPTEQLKMVLCINQELKMRTGKIAAQCAHAAVGTVLQLQHMPELLEQYDAEGHPKVTLRVPTTADLDALAAQAADLGLPVHVVEDAGMTQVDPGSRTVVAIGPAPASLVDSLTGHLKTL